MKKQGPQNLPPGKYTIKMREVKVKERGLELSATILEGPCARQIVKTVYPDYPGKPRRRRWHP